MIFIYHIYLLFFFLFFDIKMLEHKNNGTDFIKLLKVYENEPIAITESNQILIGDNQL